MKFKKPISLWWQKAYDVKWILFAMEVFSIHKITQKSCGNNFEIIEIKVNILKKMMISKEKKN